MAKENSIPQSIVDLYTELNRTVVEYESDTFSAEGEALTGPESDTITAELVRQALQSLIDCDTLDGIRLSGILEDIRASAPMTEKAIEKCARENAKALRDLMRRKGWGAGEMHYDARQYANDDSDIEAEQSKIARMSLDYLDELLEHDKKFN